MNLTFNKTLFVKTMRELVSIRKSMAPLVMRRTLNDIAYEAREDLKAEIQKSFVLRNKYTERGIWTNKATQRKIRDMSSEVGHRSGYMSLQEEGGTVVAKRKYKPIPTRYARISRSSKKLVRSIYKMRNINPKAMPGVFIRRIKGKLGIYLKNRGKLLMLWDLSRTSIVIKKRPWLEPAIAKLCRKNRIDKIFLKNAEILRKKYA